MAKKRANGEGTIRHRKDGRWEAAVMDRVRSNGKPQMKYFCGKTQKEVKEKLEKWKIEKACGDDIAQTFSFIQWSNFGLKDIRKRFLQQLKCTTNIYFVPCKHISEQKKLQRLGLSTLRLF